MVETQAGTILQYGFDFTTGAVANHGGIVRDDSGNGRSAAVLGGNGGTYTNDRPNGIKLQNTTGIGSLNLATGSITTDSTGAQSGQGVVSWADILHNGGLTMEVWVKGGTGSGDRVILTVAGTYSLQATTKGVAFVNGWAGHQKAVATADLTGWHHVAGILAHARSSGSALVAELQLYVDGRLQATYPGVFSSDSQLGTSVGNHPQLNSMGIDAAFTGLVFEPRITLGRLNPAQFTIKPPVIITLSQPPSSVTVFAGSNATFSVSATVTGASPTDLRYQWQKNQTNIVGATNTTYTTPPLALGDMSQYRCVVSVQSGAASTLSAAAQPCVVSAPKTILQWAFPHASGNVEIPIDDTSGAGHGASHLIYTGIPIYSSDIPANTRFCTGSGSIGFTGTHAALSSSNSVGVGSGQSIVSSAQVYAAGGLTMEAWIRTPAVATGSRLGAVLNMAGMYVLGMDRASGRVGFLRGDNRDDLSWTASPLAGQWMHLAVVLASPDSSATTYGAISAYLNGTLIHSGSHTFPWFLDRATSVGNHPFEDGYDYEGLVYEPRVTLGALSPSQFTIQLGPPVLSFGRIAGNLVFTWTTGTLEWADGVTGPWTAVGCVTSPYTNETSASAQFFRLRQ